MDYIDLHLPVRLFHFLGQSLQPIAKIEQPVKVGLIGASKASPPQLIIYEAACVCTTRACQTRKADATDTHAGACSTGRDIRRNMACEALA